MRCEAVLYIADHPQIGGEQSVSQSSWIFQTGLSRVGEKRKKTYIPYDYGPRLPFDANVEISTQRNVIVKELE